MNSPPLESRVCGYGVSVMRMGDVVFIRFTQSRGRNPFGRIGIRSERANESNAKRPGWGPYVGVEAGRVEVPNATRPGWGPYWRVGVGCGVGGIDALRREDFSV